MKFVPKAIFWVLCLAPLARLIRKGFHGGLGAKVRLQIGSDEPRIK
jgi:hypothetical protein